MKKTGIFLLALFVIACNNKPEGPDVSGIKVEIPVKRFDRDFFSIDTLHLENELNALNVKYPTILPIYLQTIVGAPNVTGVRTFYRLHKPLYESSEKIFRDFDPVHKQIVQAFRYVKYYFPSYELPASIVTVVGPMNSIQDLARMSNGDYTPNFLGPDFLGISLQFYLGKDFSLYKNEYFINNVAPLYRSRRFSNEYIVGDVMKVITDDIYSEKSKSKPFVEQMIEKGKQWWLLDKFLPNEPDSIKTGYTRQQLDWCDDNEGLIWSYIIKNEDLYSVNPVTLQTYLGEGPFTQGFSQELSPGNIGQWVGWQIIKKFVANNPGIKPNQVMETPAKKILDEAKYKPK